MKKLLIVSSFLILSSTVGATSVGGSIGGWNVVSQVAQGIGQKLTATKEVMINGSSKLITGTANITPKGPEIGRFMARAGGAAIVVEAMNQILNGVDYVMDPANNTVTYKDKNASDPVKTSPSTYQNPTFGITLSYTHESACSKYKPTNNDYKDISAVAVFQNNKPACYYTQYSKNTGKVYNGYVDLNVSVNPEYDSSLDSKPKTVPLSDVASQVLDQAEKDIKAGNPASPAAALARTVAAEVAKEAETDAQKAKPIVEQFQKTETYPTSEESTGTGETVTDPVTGETTTDFKFEWPKVCEWFPQACEFFDWVKKDPNLEDIEVPEKELDKKEIKDDLVKINGRSCPSDVKFDVDGLPFNIKINNAYSMQEICDTVEPLKYVFQLVTAVICALILLRV